LEAFNVLVERYQAIVYAVARRYLRDDDLAQDVTQDAFIRAWRSLDTFRNDDGFGFRAWLLRITANRALDVLRAQTRRPAGSLDAALDNDQTGWEPEEPREGAAAFAEREDLSAAIEEALGRLQPDQRLVLILYDIQGFSYEETAEITGATLGTVKSRLHRGRARLREQLLTHPGGRELLGSLGRPQSDADEAAGRRSRPTSTARQQQGKEDANA
jgi:RNA polymerase sigma-70 factor (ECF subfamily)